jgi:hypothetical protein
MATLNSDGTLADTQAKVNAAADGDTVLLPAGTFSWGTGTLSYSKGIILQGSGYTANSSTGGSNPGAPTLSTIITYTGTGQSTAINLTPLTTGTKPRISGLKFQGMTANGPHYITVVAPAGAVGYRIDNCSFDTGTNQCLPVVLAGNQDGLVDHCSFSCGNASEMLHNEAYGAGSTTGWTLDVTPGSGSMVFVEDCKFSKNPLVDTFFWGTTAIVNFYGSRTVARYNRLECCQIDVHGTTGAVGGRWYEFYNNTFYCSNNINQSNFLALRAGSGFIYNNTSIGGPVAGGSHPVFQLYSDDAANPPPYGPGAGIFVSGSPNGIHSPVYFWNNTSGISGEPANITTIATGTNVSIGVNAIVSTGTTPPYPMTVGQTATTAGGVTISSYSAYTYPHPYSQVATGGGGSGTLPLPPMNPANLGLNNPFTPVKFVSGPPTTMAWEDGAGIYPYIYNGQTQTSRINTAAPKPPTEAGPGPADPTLSKASGSYTATGYGAVGKGTLGVGTVTSVGAQSSPAQVRMFLQGGNLYIVDSAGTAYVVNPTATVPQPPVYSPTK